MLVCQIILTILILLIAALFVLNGILYRVFFGRTNIPAYSLELTMDDLDPERFPRKEISFFCADGNRTQAGGTAIPPMHIADSGTQHTETTAGTAGLRGHILKGWLFGAGNPKGLILAGHGIYSWSECQLAEMMYFVERGWQVILFAAVDLAEMMLGRRAKKMLPAGNRAERKMADSGKNSIDCEIGPTDHDTPIAAPEKESPNQNPDIAMKNNDLEQNPGIKIGILIPYIVPAIVVLAYLVLRWGGMLATYVQTHINGTI